MDNEEAIKILIRDWYSARQWAEKLLCEHLCLNEAEDVLLHENRGNRKLGDTEWYYRTHGVGVDISKPGNKGGIDFDFDKNNLEEWRLREYLIKQLNDGKLVKKYYKHFLQDQESWKRTYEKIINET